jgi:DNA-binding transcriptional regulator PaaX
MKRATEEFLYTLLWTLDAAERPTWRALTASHAGWAYRHGLLRRIRQLEEQNIIEGKIADDGMRVVRLTEAGARIARKGIHPPSLWGREWDGRWRIVFFDLAEDKWRARMRRALRTLRFGCLQRSVWISPEPSAVIKDALATEKIEVPHLVIVDGRPETGGEDLVKASWDFDRIGQLYKNWQKHAAPLESPDVWERMPASARNDWLREERELWGAIIRVDPFLPASLLPGDYRGREVWEERCKLLPRLLA